MNTSNSSDNADARRASPRCFNWLPSSKSNPDRNYGPKAFGPFLPPGLCGPARFDDYATDWVARALAGTSITGNAHLLGGTYVAPLAIDELNAIYAAILAGRTHGGEIFGEVMVRKHRSLFAGIVQIEDDTTSDVVVKAGKGFGSGPLSLPCQKVTVLLEALASPAHGVLEMPLKRWLIARRKFYLPKGKCQAGTNFVPGPYLMVGAYEPDSGAFARARMWPVWYSPQMGRMSVVRSNLERGGAAALAATGAVGCTLINRAHLLMLQEGLGHLWPGDLGTYSYHPDYVMMPVPGHPPVVCEAFGIRNLKRYDAGKAVKKSHGLQNASIRFTAIEAPKLTEDEVFRQMTALVADPANYIWHPPTSLSAAA